MRRALLLCTVLAATPAHADVDAAVVDACAALASLSRALVELRFHGIPRETIEAHVVRAEPAIDAPMAGDLAWRAFRLPDTPSVVVQARFRATVGHQVESECLTRLTAAVKGGKP